MFHASVPDGGVRRTPETAAPLPEALAALAALLDAADVALAVAVGPTPVPRRTAAWRAAEADPHLAATLAAAWAEGARAAAPAVPGADALPGAPREVGRADGRRMLAHAAPLDDGRRLVAVVVAPASDAGASDEALVARYGLSAREAEVARLIAAGRTTPQIAAALGISAHTVKRHRERTFAKLGVHSRRAVRARLREAGRDAPAERR